MMMAMEFMVSSTTSRTMIADAALVWKASCGREAQLKIWIGRTVKRSNGPLGVKGTKSKAPIMISGAVSPMARERARMMPVIMPGRAAGTTW